MCRILKYQFPLPYQLSLRFLESFKNTAAVELFNFKDPTQSSDFDSNYIKTQLLTLLEKKVGNHNMSDTFQNIISLTDILVVPPIFSNDLRTSPEVKVINCKDSIQNTDFGNSRGRTVFHLLEMSVGNQYLKDLRILVLPEILLPLEISAQFETHSLRPIEYLSRSQT